MLSSVFLKNLRDQRRGIIWWSIGLILLGTVIMYFYQILHETAEMSDAIEAYSKALPEDVMALFTGGPIDYMSIEGFLNAELYFLMVPALFIIYGIARGSGSVAGEEARGTLDLLLAFPLSRGTIVIQKFLAMASGLFLVVAVFWFGLVLAALLFGGIVVSAWNLASVTMSGFLLAMVFGTLSLATGAVTGNRGSSIGVAGALAVASYFINALGPIVHGLEPYRIFSPFYYYISADPLMNGLNLSHAGVLVILILGLLTLAVLGFNRRDLKI